MSSGSDAPRDAPLKYEPLQGTQAPPSAASLAEPLRTEATSLAASAASASSDFASTAPSLSDAQLLAKAAELKAAELKAAELKALSTPSSAPSFSPSFASSAPAPAHTPSVYSAPQFEQARTPQFDSPSKSLEPPPTVSSAPAKSFDQPRLSEDKAPELTEVSSASPQPPPLETAPPPLKSERTLPTPTALQSQPAPSASSQGLPTQRQADPRQGQIPAHRAERQDPQPSSKRNPVPPQLRPDSASIEQKRRFLCAALHGTAFGNLFLLGSWLLPLGLVFTYVFFKVVKFSSRGLQEHFGKSMNFQISWLIVLGALSVFSRGDGPGLLWVLAFLAGLGLSARAAYLASEGKPVSYPSFFKPISERG